MGHYTTFPSWNGLSTEMDGELQQSLEASGMEALTDGSGNVQACNDCQVTSDLVLVSNYMFMKVITCHDRAFSTCARSLHPPHICVIVPSLAPAPMSRLCLRLKDRFVQLCMRHHGSKAKMKASERWTAPTP